MMTASIHRDSSSARLGKTLLAEQEGQRQAILRRIEAADKLPAEARSVALAVAEIDLAEVGQNLELLQARVLPRLK